MTAWDCLLDQGLAKALRAIVRSAGTGNMFQMWMSSYRSDVVWTDAPAGSIQWTFDIHMSHVCRSLEYITSKPFKEMDDECKGILRNHSDLALYWLDGKEKLLQWEHSTELKQQRELAQTTYEQWKRQHKASVLRMIRDDLYDALRDGIKGDDGKDHDGAGELEVDVHDNSDGEEVRSYDIAPKPYRPGNVTRRMESSTIGIKGDDAKDHDGAGELEVDVHDNSDGEEVRSYDIAPKPYRPGNVTRRMESSTIGNTPIPVKKRKVATSCGQPTSSPASTLARVGRPRKHPRPSEDVTSRSTRPTASTAPKHGRGRPRKHPLPHVSILPELPSPANGLPDSKLGGLPEMKRGRGRPRMHLVAPVTLATEKCAAANNIDDDEATQCFTKSSKRMNTVVEQPTPTTLKGHSCCGCSGPPNVRLPITLTMMKPHSVSPNLLNA
ncbi:unnamed protein product [Calypogeia fissa]